MKFESELEKGNFITSECKYCKKIVWPPSELCNSCFKETSWRHANREGVIIEFSKQDDVYFCLVEFENAMKLIGKISKGIPSAGDKVMLDKCGIKNSNHYYEMSLISQANSV